MSPTIAPAVSSVFPHSSEERVLDTLIAALGSDNVLRDAAAAERPCADWSGLPAAPPRAVLLPHTPAQVAEALAICTRFGQPVAVQGGLTGLAGGANPHPGEIALSLARLDAIEDFDEVGGTVLVQAGVTLEQLQNAARERGWFFPLDLGARGSCQLGGNAATNAGGNRVLRHGMMRESVLGLEVALADGRLLSMLGRMVKNNAGYDLKHLFIGSEGTLGIITRLSLKLVPAPVASCTVLCALADFDAATRLLREARRRLPELTAFELMWDDYFQASGQAIGRSSPFNEPHALYALIETLGSDAAAGVAAIEAMLESALGGGIVADAVVAQSARQALQLWAFREGVGELLAALKPCIAFDVSTELPVMDALVRSLRNQLGQRFPGQQHLFFGHLGDGNLHVVTGPYAEAAQRHEVEEVVYAAVGAVGGSISAEHGIGMVKKPFLHYSRDAAQVGLMRGMKQLLDPAEILNRGRVIDIP